MVGYGDIHRYNFETSNWVSSSFSPRSGQTRNLGDKVKRFVEMVREGLTDGSLNRIEAILALNKLGLLNTRHC